MSWAPQISKPGIASTKLTDPLGWDHTGREGRIVRVSNRGGGQGGGGRLVDRQAIGVELQADFHYSRIIENASISGKFFQSERQPQEARYGPWEHIASRTSATPRIPRLQEDFMPRQTLRITRSVQPFVVLKDNLGRISRQPDGLQKIKGYLGVGFSQGEFKVSQFSRFGEEA